jgi:uncharacterized membrane protein
MKAIFTKNRFEAFSDGIFAIIVTLLVLEIKVPHIKDPASPWELFIALFYLLPKFLSWIISFLTVCVIWVNHHRLMNVFRSIDHGIFWWNAILLLWVSFIPFPTALLGDYPGNQLAGILYALILSFMGFSFYFLRRHVSRHPGLLQPSADLEEFRKGTRLVLIFGPLLYLTGGALVFVHPYLAFVVFLTVTIYFIFPHATKDYEKE